MGRRARSFCPGVPTHLISRGVDGESIFRSDIDRYDLLALLRKMTARIEWQVITWCLMTTHYHLLVAAPKDARVSWAMQTVNSVYARDFNSRHGRRGALFGDRFADTLVESDGQLRRTIAYILDNPVRAGIVKRYDEWNWSGLETLRPRDELVTPTGQSWHQPVRRAG